MNKFSKKDISSEELSDRLFNNTTLISVGVESEELNDIENNLESDDNDTITDTIDNTDESSTNFDI